MKHLSRVFIAICFIILYAPILVLMLFSFNSTASTGVFSGFSLYWYGELFKSGGVFNALRNTLILAVTSSLTATVIGTCAAVGLDRMRSRRMRGIVSSITNVPMMNPDIVTGVSMMLLFVFVGTLIGATEDKLNFWTLFIAHVTFNLPYVILNVSPKLRQMDRNLPEAALDLGCTPLQSFFKVELPAILPGVLSGLLARTDLAQCRILCHCGAGELRLFQDRRRDSGVPSGNGVRRPAARHFRKLRFGQPPGQVQRFLLLERSLPD